jgi:isoquinoline 1-oxidoreductase beta subunit
MAEDLGRGRFRKSRRSFLIASGVAAAGAGAGIWAWPEATSVAGQRINDFVVVAEDGTIEVLLPAQDLGQGATTVLPMILAEEIGADLHRLRIHVAPRDASRYGNPAFDGRLVTADSKTTSGYFDLLRRAGAQTRLALIAAAASSRGWNPADCRAEGHAVRHRVDHATMDFAAIAQTAGSLRAVEVGGGDLKARRDYVLIGSSPAPRDLMAKVTGAFAFGVDRRSPDALVAMVVRSPHLRGLPLEVDESAARQVADVEAVVRLEDGVAVVARNTYAARKGASQLKVQWTPPVAFDDLAQAQALIAALAGAEVAPQVVAQSGDVAAAGDAPIAVDMSFTTPQVSHLALEPLNAEARARALGLGVAIRGSGQSSDLDMRYAARAWKTAPFMIEIHTAPSGGAFGRRVLNDTVRDAATIAKALGKPVQVIRPLADELRRGQVRPASAHRVAARADAAGRLLYWEHTCASDSVLARQLPSTFEAKGRQDNTATDGLRHPYRVAAGEILRWCRHESPPEPGFLRGVSAGTTIFASETVVDVVARRAGRDPLEWRLAHVEAQAGRRVLERVAAMAHWGAVDGARRGIALMSFRGSWIATVATLVRQAGEARIERLDIAADVGLAIHPRLVIGQIEGAAMFGLSLALFEHLHFRDGAAVIDGVASYPVLRADRAPAIQVELVGAEQAERPGGAGEIGVPTVAPAIGNALATFAGQYQTHLPLRLGIGGQTGRAAAAS